MNKEIGKKHGVAEDLARSQAGFGGIYVVQEYGNEGEMIDRRIVDTDPAGDGKVVDTDYATEEYRVKRQEEETFDYIKTMEADGIKRADEYKRNFDNYECSLKKIESYIQDLNLCTTQTSLNFSIISLWLEIEFFTTKLRVLHDELKYNTFYAFCCDINFREWAKKMHQYSEHIHIYYPEGRISDEMYLQPLGSIPHAYITPTNNIADDDTFSFLQDSMRPYGRSSNMRDFIALRQLSTDLLPVLSKFRESCDSDQLRRGIKSRLEVFCDDLDGIYLMITSPSLDSLGSVYYCFEADNDEIAKEIDAFVETNKSRVSFVRLASERMKKLLEKQISKYCNKDQWHDLFDWSDNDCQPDYERLGEFIFGIRNDPDRIEKAKDIVRLVEYWLHYNWAIMTYEENRKAENDGKDIGDISDMGIPADLMKYILIQGREKLIKFANLVKGEAIKLRDEYGKEDFWDYFYFTCVHFKFIRIKPYKMKCSRAKFAEILSWLLYGSAKEAKNINYSMEKSGLQASNPENAIRHALKSEVGKNLKNLIENQSLV